MVAEVATKSKCSATLMKGKCAKLQFRFSYLSVLRSFAAPYSALVVTGEQAYQRADLANRTFFW
jgi:hypothetical protein